MKKISEVPGFGTKSLFSAAKNVGRLNEMLSIKGRLCSQSGMFDKQDPAAADSGESRTAPRRRVEHVL